MAEKKSDTKTAKKEALTANEKAVLLHALSSAMQIRAEIASRLGKSFGDKRDLYETLGYSKTPSFNDYMACYERQDIAKAIIDKPVEACWGKPPEISESLEKQTEFETAWTDLNNRIKIWHYLSRVDQLASIGEYAVLLMGFDDSGGFDKAVTGKPKLLYLCPYSQADTEISEYEKNPKNERFGLPLIYSIKMRSGILSEGSTSKDVHWSRVIHVAQGCLQNDVFGTPQLRSVLNRLQDLDKILGGSAEMFWRGAWGGLNFKLDPDANLSEPQKTDMIDEIEKYIHRLQRYIRTVGVDVQELGGTVADPASHVDAQLTLISAATGIPKRILLGSERGELASSQDEKSWMDQVDQRRKLYCESFILRPLIDRLIKLKALSTPQKGYQCIWPDLMQSSEKEKAEVGEIKSRTLGNYANSIGADTVVPRETFLTDIMGMSKEKVEQIDKILEGSYEDEDADADE